jgi:phosphatidylglycerol:prolipoprotein diacylglycerol transferase
MKYIYWTTGIIAILASVVFFFVPAFQGQIKNSPGILIGNFQLRWYGLTMALAILAAYLVSRRHAWRFGISKNDVDDYSFWAIIVAILGARLYYILFNLNYFTENLHETYRIWHGGISIYGGLLAALLFTYFYTRKKAYSFSQLFDLVALGLPLGQAIGRLGNFFNQEAFGFPTNLPWKMYVEPGNRPIEYVKSDFFHPAFLYEIILNLIVFAILQRMLGKTKSGVIGWAYLGLYSLGRFFVEGFRLDSFFFQGVRIDQVVAGLVLLLSGGMILRRRSLT